jgi:hypothetical protein
MLLHLLTTHYQLVVVLLAWGVAVLLELGLNHAAHQNDPED